MRCDVLSEGQRPCLIQGTHEYHFDGASWWPNEDYLPPAPKFKPGRKRVDRISSQTHDLLTRARQGTQPDDSVEQPESPSTWDEAGWIDHAYGVLLGFLKDRTEPFTTPEHLWPLLPDPAPEVDRRVLVRVVRQALREGLIQEVGAVRLKDTYRTADGSEFSINKLSPRYAPAARR